MNTDFIDIYNEVDSEIETLKSLAQKYGPKVTTEQMRPHQLSVFIDLDNYFRARIYLDFKISRNSTFSLYYYLAFQQRRNVDNVYGTIYPKRNLVPKQVINLGDYHYGHYNITQGNSISAAGEAVMQLVIKLKTGLLTMCRKSTSWYNKERMNETLEIWYSEANHFSISKEMPIRRMISGIKAPQQSAYDYCYGLHGSNGTYVENANPQWVLNFKIRRLDFAVDESIYMSIDIHRYITKTLMPNRDWGRITEARLEQLNKSLENRALKVMTREMYKAPCYRKFVPVDYATWEDALNTILSI